MNECLITSKRTTYINHLVLCGCQGRPRATCSGGAAGYALEVLSRVKWTAHNTFCLRRSDGLLQVGDIALKGGSVDEQIPRVHARALCELRGVLRVARFCRSTRRLRLGSTAGRCVAPNFIIDAPDRHNNGSRRVHKSRGDVSSIDVQVHVERENRIAAEPAAGGCM